MHQGKPGIEGLKALSKVASQVYHQDGLGVCKVAGAKVVADVPSPLPL